MLVQSLPYTSLLLAPFFAQISNSPFKAVAIKVNFCFPLPTCRVTKGYVVCLEQEEQLSVMRC